MRRPLWARIIYAEIITHKRAKGELITYGKTKDGLWVVCGPVDAIKADTDVAVSRLLRRSKVEHVNRIGRLFYANGQMMVYGYLEKDTRRRREMYV